MTKYQLAKLVQSIGVVDTRKRLQKVVYLLKSAGCPLESDFILHHYGPYSHSLAYLTDEMVRDGILVEECSPNATGQQYSYELNSGVAESLAEFEKSKPAKAAKEFPAAWKAKTTELAKADLKLLELASTVAYYRNSGNSWDKAGKETARFKEVSPESSILTKAVELAKGMVK